MEYFDLHTSGEWTEKSDFLNSLGFSGIGVICNSLEELKKIKKEGKGGGIRLMIFKGILIDSKDPRRDAIRNRKKAELLFVKGGDLDINRAAVETPEIDVLTNPWGDPESLRSDPGFNYVLARLAKENNVSIEFNLGHLIHTYDIHRSRILANMMKAAKLIRKYKAPFILTSGAVSKWDLRSPSELTSFGKLLGLDEKRIKDSLSGKIAIENRKRLSGKWVQPGVELE